MLRLYFACALPWLLLSQVAPNPAETLITQIRASRMNRDPRPALDAIASLEASLGVIEGEHFERLSAIMLDPSAHAIVRTRLVTLLSTKAGDAEARVLLTTMHRVADEYRIAVEKGLDSEMRFGARLYLHSGLVRQFLETGAEPLATRLKDRSGLFDFYLALLENPLTRYPRIRQRSLELIASAPDGVDVRQDYMLRAVARLADGRGPDVFIALVTDDVVPRLREIAFDGPVGSKGYNLAALDVLAEHGDLETAERLRNWWKEHGFDDALLDTPGSHVWMIESQHNHQLLLDQIASEDQSNLQTQLWAVQHAVKLGVIRDRLRTALLAYVGNLRSAKKHDAFAARIKELAVENELLRPSEFPDFPETDADTLYRNIRRATGTLPASAEHIGNNNGN